MMDDFPRGVPCRVVFFPPPLLAPNHSEFSLSIPFRHHGRRGNARDTTGVCFSRERLNVKQETAAEQSFVDGRNNTYIHTVQCEEEKRKRRVCVYSCVCMCI